MRDTGGSMTIFRPIMRQQRVKHRLRELTSGTGTSGCQRIQNFGDFNSKVPHQNKLNGANEVFLKVDMIFALLD